MTKPETVVLKATAFPKALHDALRAAAADRDISMARLVVEAIKAHPDVARHLTGAPPARVESTLNSADALEWE